LAIPSDSRSQVLSKDGVRIPITTKALEVLLLVESHGETVSKAQLRAAVWGGIAVEDNNLNQSVSAIRKALGERPGEQKYILTVTRFGYRFVAPDTSISKCSPEPVTPAASSNRRHILFTVLPVLLLVGLAGGWVAHRRAAASRAASIVPHNTQAFEF
jgi:DNA-binding winged helix-turn-helix (wHTH) protein